MSGIYHFGPGLSQHLTFQDNLCQSREMLSESIAASRWLKVQCGPAEHCCAGPHRLKNLFSACLCDFFHRDWIEEGH